MSLIDSIVHGPSSTMADEAAELARRAQAGDVAAFERLYHTHASHVRAICMRLCADAQRAEESAQDAWVRAWERLSTWRGDAAFGTWLHRLTVNVVLESFRSERRRIARVMLSGDDEDVDAPFAASEPGDAIDLEHAIARLPRGARTVFVLHDVEGYRHPEIAAMTGLAEGTLRAQLCRARRLLMEMLDR
ncbi:MAG TPA: RNA polymerase sigma factor [Gemmatimonadaceae bacterium]|nr:RNA polymerase sigma factor [Gemmatimonadaceae bacterium]